MKLRQEKRRLEEREKDKIISDLKTALADARQIVKSPRGIVCGEIQGRIGPSMPQIKGMDLLEEKT